MSRDLRLSDAYGVNPTIPICFVCGKEKNELLLMGRMWDKEKQKEIEAPRDMVWDREPCQECKEWMKKGVILISVRDGENDENNPWRTGGWVVMKEEAVRNIFGGAVVEEVLKKRMAFVEDKAWDEVGLPRS